MKLPSVNRGRLIDFILTVLAHLVAIVLATILLAWIMGVGGG
jgi:hypothetical protein